MKGEFSKWYATSFPQEASFIEQRWKAIDACSEELRKSSLVLLTTLAFRLKPPKSSTEVSALRQALTGEAAAVGDEELHILSASTLAVAMGSTNKDIVALAASIVASASCGGLRDLKQPMDLVGQSDNVLRQLSETSRRRPALEQAKFVTPLLDKADPTLLKALDNEIPSDVAQALIGATNKALSKMASRQREFEAAVQKYVTIQDEELDILWWIEGGHSFDLAQDFSKIEAEHLPLAIARELAGLTKVLPGPPALSSLLSRTGLLDAPLLSIPGCVQSMPIDWLNNAVDKLKGEDVSPALTPILFALQRRHEVDGQDDWISAWSTTTGLSREPVLSPLQIAVAAYREISWTQLG
ncbi:GTPase-associated system all-helical protein GASH [Chitinimonas sp. BJB300]|uniref:GTPase-associated system all-helical protein GASH n=1 Tax=Chitinimonas sp. BJB300 TaxID=1559339 RepID=UPI000C0FBF63|nr:GTPase-associated system all-helical protein GASH [Chitinimonas sp. BJB300]PHV10314.1 hypothetical protein CSQ89_16900 [Chitinimonas sp. BJB300]TSJ83292.1 hypothetical protein FG002_021270 [Chitinimonas sp. BJB300]